MLTYKDGKGNTMLKVGRSIAWWFIIGTLFIAEGCYHPSSITIERKRPKINYKFVTDNRGKLHKYRYFPRVHDFGGGDVAVEYCARHKRWESISVKWTKDGYLKFNVRRHKKDHRW
tara:strand:- start:206 stop:553 length:348 start_codon:yes stop_codon:yes gene_type:complete